MPMIKLQKLHQYEDSKGNKVIVSREYLSGINVTFKGENNELRIADGANIGMLNLTFDGNNGRLVMGHNLKNGYTKFNIRVGEDSTVTIGDNVSTTGPCVISAVEGTSVTIGDDVMIATNNQIRADDGHAIFDVSSGDRVNRSKSISVGDHVWLAYDACILGGAQVGSGSVIGFRAVVTGKISNNVVAAGIPAKTVRRNIAWERPHLSLTEPAYKPHISVMEKSEDYWKITAEENPVVKRRSIFGRFLGRSKS